mmetsp:Transcript_12729/g.21458  ORF Transcript_12729/g.21458 Transcript_12729/m.21458 type:complete len:168 (-) Transcript_12729:194-697(-)
MHEQKRYRAHAYQSANCDVTVIHGLLAQMNVDFETYVIKAASKAYSRVFGVAKVNVSRVIADQVSQANGLNYIPAANEKQLSQLMDLQLHDGLQAFSNQAPQSEITVSQVDNSLESLPIVNQNTQISLHFTNPSQEVVAGGATPGQVFDIEELDDEHLDYSLHLKVA